MADVDEFLATATRRPGATPQAIRDTEAALGHELPEDYANLLKQSNGCEGPVGNEGWVRFLSMEEVVSQSADYAAFEQFRGLTLIGTDGGDEAFCVDAGGAYFAVPFIGSAEDRVAAGASLNELLTALGDGKA